VNQRWAKEFRDGNAVSTTTRQRVGLLIADLRLPIAIGLGRNMNLKSAIDNWQSDDPPATAWWY